MLEWDLTVKNFVVDILDEDTFHLALPPFIKAMGFAEYYGDEQEIEEWIANSIRMFYKKGRFHCVGVRESQGGNSANYVGFSSLIPVETTGWIPYVGVDSNFQGRGLGRKLMLKVLEIAREIPLETIELCSSQAGIPFYQSLDFKANYPICGYDIVEPRKNSKQELQIDTTMPDWILKKDREVVGIDRQKLFQIHRYDQVPIINDPGHGYGFLYKTRIGPIIADSLSLAQEILLKAIELGATSLILVEDAPLKKQLKDVATLKPQPLLDNLKMTFGTPLQQDLSRLYGLRSVAYG